MFRHGPFSPLTFHNPLSIIIFFISSLINGLLMPWHDTAFNHFYSRGASDKSDAVKSRSLIDNYNGRHQHHQEQHQQSRRYRWPDVVAGVVLNTIINYLPVSVWDKEEVEGWDILFIIKLEARRWRWGDVLISPDNLPIISLSQPTGMWGCWGDLLALLVTLG